jgi:hypothetical protein
MGFERGWNVASWCDLPEIGQEIPRHVDWVGYREVTAENLRDVWEMYCHESESNDRQFSPFEMTAHDLNELADSKPYDPWEIFEDGIRAGISAYWRKHYSQRRAA